MGAIEGISLNTIDGPRLGTAVGPADGSRDGVSVGAMISVEGIAEGSFVGVVGTPVSRSIRYLDGCRVRGTEGDADGCRVGAGENVGE